MFTAAKFLKRSQAEQRFVLLNFCSTLSLYLSLAGLTARLTSPFTSFLSASESEKKTHFLIEGLFVFSRHVRRC